MQQSDSSFSGQIDDQSLSSLSGSSVDEPISTNSSTDVEEMSCTASTSTDDEVEIQPNQAPSCEGAEFIPHRRKEQGMERLEDKNGSHTYDRVGNLSGSSNERSTPNSCGAVNTRKIPTFEGKKSYLQELVEDESTGPELQKFCKKYRGYVKGSNIRRFFHIINIPGHLNRILCRIRFNVKLTELRVGYGLYYDDPEGDNEIP